MANTISAETTADSTPGASVSDSVLEAAGRASRSWIVGGIWWIVLSAVVTAVLAYLAWRASDRQNELVIAAANVRISDAQRESSEANKIAAEANERSKALERDNLILRGKVAGLEKDAASAKTELAVQRERTAKAETELLKVQERIKPRHFSDVDRARLKAFLVAHPKGDVQVFVSTGPESANFGGEIILLLKESGWNITASGPHFSQGSLIPGLVLEVKEFHNAPIRAQSLVDGFQLVGVVLTGIEMDLKPDDIVLRVGPKE